MEGSLLIISTIGSYILANFLSQRQFHSEKQCNPQREFVKMITTHCLRPLHSSPCRTLSKSKIFRSSKLLNNPYRLKKRTPITSIPLISDFYSLIKILQNVTPGKSNASLPRPCMNSLQSCLMPENMNGSVIKT